MPEEQTQMQMFQAELLASVLGHVLPGQGQEELDVEAQPSVEESPTEEEGK